MTTFPPRALSGVLLAAAIGLNAAQAVPAVAVQPLSSAERVVILVAGDLLPESPWASPSNPNHLLDSMRDEFSKADLVFLNLEEPITSSETVTSAKDPAKIAAGADYVLCARNPQIPESLKRAGVGLVGLANNHMMDYTAEGLRDTLRFFQNADLPVVGAGLKSDAERAFVLERAGRRVALLAFSDVVPPTYQAGETDLGIASAKNRTDLVRAIQAARKQADFVVLMVHWGGQGKHLITRRQQKLGRIAARAGCDAVVGMHPHVLQGAEYVGRVPVIYSVGNFGFPSRRNARREAVLAKLTLGSRGLEQLEFVPVEISGGGVPRIARGRSGRIIEAHLDAFCRMFNTQVRSGRLTRAKVREALVYDEGTADAPGNKSEPAPTAPCA